MDEYEMPHLMSVCRAMKLLAIQERILTKLESARKYLAELNELEALSVYNRTEYFANLAAIASINSAKSAVKLEFAGERHNWL